MALSEWCFIKVSVPRSAMPDKSCFSAHAVHKAADYRLTLPGAAITDALRHKLRSDRQLKAQREACLAQQTSCRSTTYQAA